MVLGCGTVGLLWGQMLKNSPCSRLLMTDIVEFRRKKAAEITQPSAVLDASQADFADRVRAELPGGVDYIIDATGEPAAIEQAIPLLARGGTFMIFGVCPTGSAVKVDPFELYNKQARIIASKMPPATLDRAARLIESGIIPCDRIVTDTRGLSRLSESVAAFTAARSSQIKMAIDPWK